MPLSSNSLKSFNKNRSGGETPSTFIIFGVTGDLSQKKLLPSLFDLHVKGFLPKNLKIVGFSRRDWDKGKFCSFVEKTILKAGDLSDSKKKAVPSFLDHLVHVHGNLNDPESYEDLKKRINSIEESFGRCGNKLFHLAVPPSLYEVIFKNLADSGLTIPCGGDLGWSRVLVEKPFGSDAKTASNLDSMLGKLFKEEQIFRIDHYLAKETLQNILYFRFSNAMFEPLWNKNCIERVEVSLLENHGISGRGSFYDEVGALRDVGQNHLLQMLALVAMEKPLLLDAKSLRNERSRALKQLETISSEQVKEDVLRGQYEGYNKEEGVEPGSQTETYFKVKAFLKNSRWSGVPFYLESGKCLKRSEASIKIFFKAPETLYFEGAKNGAKREGVNQLTFRIQPDEGIDIHFWVKKPGLESELEERALSYSYDAKPETIPSAYEKLLFDCVKGDQTLFASTEEVQASWKFISSILDNWSGTPLHIYKQEESPERVGLENINVG